MATTRRFTLKPNTTVTPCPRCGNNTRFTGCSVQVAEDCCEVYVVCQCSYDPTERNSIHRFEDVWGGVDDERLMAALSCWDSALADVAIKH